MTFQRARTEQQREERRRAILATATEMLGEMPVSALTLNELSRRVGLAKSNVMRYFETREAVLLQLLAAAADELLGTAERARIDPSLPVAARVDAISAELAASFAAAPMLCELLSAQASVLERNVSEEVALRFKRSSRDSLLGLAAVLMGALPELDEPRAAAAATLLVVLTGALWTHTHPPPAVRSAYAADASLGFLDGDFETVARQAFAALLTGLAAA